MNMSKPFAALCMLFMFMLSSCAFPGIVSTSAQLPAARPTPQATPLPPVRFPQDEAAHRDLTEWWYYTGHMNATAPDGKSHHYGFELVFFQALRSDLPPVYAAHFAISDITRGEFHFDQRSRIEPDAFKDSASTVGIHVSIGDWSIEGLNGLDHLVASMANYGIHVDLRGLKQPILHNGNGLITYGLGGFSYYYSRTRMALTGTLVDHNIAVQVTGEAWMDHQWGNFLTLGGGGWDWFSVQMNNLVELMIYLIRDASGKIISTYIGYIDANGQDYLPAASTLEVKVLGYWRSPTTGSNYPSGWELQINDVRVQVSLVLTPELKNQELVVYQSTGNSYWEGAVDIVGQSAGKPVQGEGYVELTGYARG
jgi:predicted secreted hydrolase